MTRRQRPPARRAGTAVLAAAATLGACDPELSTPVADQTLQTMESDYVAFGMVSYLTQNGLRTGRIDADTAYVYEQTAIAVLKQMEIIFYDEVGGERATVTGRDGEWGTETNRMVARGDVLLLIHEDSSTIESAEIYYDQDLERIWSDSTTIRRFNDGSVFSGSSFESDMEFENIRIANMRGGLPRN